jgi:hypothetical protein
MQNNTTILFIVLMILSTVIIVTLLEVHLSKVVINKDIEVNHTIEVKLIEGKVKSTFGFGCRNVIQNPVSEHETLKNERKKRVIRKFPLSYHHTNSHRR